MTQECRHLMPAAWCAFCTPPPAKELPIGYRTRGGDAYHNDPDCSWLDKGQRYAHSLGMNTDEKERIAWAAVTPGELRPAAARSGSGAVAQAQWLRRHGR